MIQQYLKRTKRLFLTLLLLWTVSFASASINHKATIAFVTTKTTRDLSTKKRRNDFASFSVVSDQQEEGVKAEKKSKEESLLPNNEGTTTAVSSVKKKEKSARLDLPWADFHEWALRDNIPKYTRILPGVTPKTYALWRTMLQDVPELSGYPISFLQEKCTQKSNATSSDSSKQEIPDVLPYLDNFYFEPSGGLSGQVCMSLSLLLLFVSCTLYAVLDFSSFS